MTRTEAIATIAAMLPRLSDERVQVLAEFAHDWADERRRPDESAETRAAIANGVAQGQRGEFGSDAEVAEAFARFRK